ncbi:unnamed protein product [Caenorhabditis brenneri]
MIGHSNAIADLGINGELQTPNMLHMNMIPFEKAEEVIGQMQPLPVSSSIVDKTYKHHPVDRNFIQLLDDLKPTQTIWVKPNNPLSEEEQRRYNASRMREYRRKSSETLEKTKAMLDGLKTQCTVNTVTLKNMLDNKTVEDQVRKYAAQICQITEEELMSIPDILIMFQQYWCRRRAASESHYEQKSLIYLQRIVTLQNELLKYKSTHGSRSSSQLVKKIKDAVMKAQSYEYFMDDKRVRKVIGELVNVDNKFKEVVGKWLVDRVQTNNAEKASFPL